MDNLPEEFKRSHIQLINDVLESSGSEAAKWFQDVADSWRNYVTESLQKCVTQMLEHGEDNITWTGEIGEDTSIAKRELSWPALSEELQKPQLQTWNFLQELLNKKPDLFPPKFTTNRTYKTLAGLHERLVQVIIPEDMRMENLQVAQIMDTCDANAGANDK